MRLKSNWAFVISLVVFGSFWCWFGYIWGCDNAKTVYPSPDWIVTPQVVVDCSKSEAEAERRGRDAMEYELLKKFTFVCQDYRTYLIPK